MINDHPEKREFKRVSEATSKKIGCPTLLFECSVHGSIDAFETFAQLELHLDVGKHNLSKLNQLDTIRRYWALKFISVDAGNPKTCSSDSTKLQASAEDTNASLSL